MTAHKLNKSASGEHFVLVGPYNATLVAQLKAEVPASHREWRPVAKCWRILPPYDGAVRRMIGGDE